jgi:predicted nucleic acid-binding protein
MIIVADSSALIALAVCNGLNLLDQLFTEVKVLLAVFNEVTAPNKAMAVPLKHYLTNKIAYVASSAVMVDTGGLGRGEFEAMVLYKELQADYLLLDDRQARKVAIYNQIKVVGSLGILLLAKEEGLIALIKPFLERLQASDIYLSDSLINHTLYLAGE